MKTNAMRILDRLKIEYEVRSYEVDESDLSAPAVAGKIGLDVQQVYKTLVVRAGEREVYLAVVPGDAVLDFKALSKAIGHRKMEMVPLKQVHKLTGYVRGGVTALGTPKPLPVWAHSDIAEWPVISISAGKRGLQLLLDPADYLRATDAKTADIVA